MWYHWETLGGKMKNFDEMVEYYRNHPEEAKNILKHAGKLEEDKWSSDMKEIKNVDELFLDNVSVHYEVMDPSGSVWFSFTHPNGQIDHFTIVCKGKKLSTLYSCNTGNVKGPDVEEPTIVPEHRY
jgi:hypothetical protein